MIDYTISHFVFEDVGFDDLLEHKKNHNTFSDWIFSFRNRLVKGENIVGGLLKMLHDW